MAAIVILHCGFQVSRSASPLEAALMVQPFKFGTISFFIISGFLAGDRLPASGRLGYLRRRASRLLPAWVLWYFLWILYVIQGDLRQFQPGEKLSIARIAICCLTQTPLWFVPNFLVALTCVVMLRRWLNDLRLGAVLLAVNIFYGVNVYTRWLPSRHSEAVFGFVFYLWLGAWCALRKQGIQDWARALSPWWLCFWACIASCLAIWESSVLRAHGSPDPLNSLRFANQIYSVLIAILLVRIRRRTWPIFINVADTTYGVYLCHGIVLGLVIALVKRLIPEREWSGGTVLLIWALLAVAVYYVSVQLTRAFASSPRLGWAVGASKPELRKPRRRDVPTEAVVIQPTEA